MQQGLGERILRLVSLALFYPVLILLSLGWSAYFGVATLGEDIVASILEDKLQGRGGVEALDVDPSTGSLGLAGLTFNDPDGNNVLSVGSMLLESTSPIALTDQQIMRLSVSDVELTVDVDEQGKINWEKLKRIKPPSPPSPPQPFLVGSLDVQNVRIHVHSPMADLVVGPLSLVGSVSGDEQEHVNARTVLTIEKIAVNLKKHPQTEALLALLPAPEFVVGPIELKLDWADPVVSLHKLNIDAAGFTLASNGEIDFSTLQGHLLLMLAQGDNTLFRLASRREGDQMDLTVELGPLTIPSLPLPDLPLPPIPLGALKVAVNADGIRLSLHKQPLPADLLAYIAPEGGFMDIDLALVPDQAPLLFFQGLAAAGPAGKDYVLKHLLSVKADLAMDVPQFLPDGVTQLKGFKLQKTGLDLKDKHASFTLQWNAEQLLAEDTVVMRPAMVASLAGIPATLAEFVALVDNVRTPGGDKALFDVVRMAKGALTFQTTAVTIGPKQVMEKLYVEGSMVPAEQGVAIQLKGAPAPLGSVMLTAQVGPFGPQLPYSAKLEIPRLDLNPIIQAAQVPAMVGQMFGGVLAGVMEWTSKDAAVPILDVANCDLKIRRPNEVIRLKTPDGVQTWDFTKEPSISPMVLMTGGELAFGDGKLVLTRSKDQAKDDGAPAK